MTNIETRLLDYMQMVLWDQLNNDLRNAHNGHWSIASEGTVTRLVWLIRVRGATDAGKIQLPLLASGVYHAVCQKAGVKAVVDFDLDRYIEYWIKTYERYMLAVPKIQEMEVGDFEKEIEL